MNLNDLSTQLLFTTVPIWAELANGDTSVATGFIFNVPADNNPDQSIPILVTNKHVVNEAKRIVIELADITDNKPNLQNPVRIELRRKQFELHASDSIDLAIAPLGPALNQSLESGRPVFFRAITPDLIPSDEKLSELAALEDIVFIGYPSGLRDPINGWPLIRRGITSTPAWSNFGGNPYFLIDAGVFPGSSGSPVFILNQGAYSTKDALVVGHRIIFLGIIFDTFIRKDEGPGVFLGLGRVLRSSSIIQFIDETMKRLSSTHNLA